MGGLSFYEDASGNKYVVGADTVPKKLGNDPRTVTVSALGSASRPVTVGGGVIDCRGYDKVTLSLSGSGTGRKAKYMWNIVHSFSWPSISFSTETILTVDPQKPYLVLQIEVGGVNNNSHINATLE